MKNTRIFGKISVSIAPVTREASFSSEMTTQLLFGEKISIIDIVNSKWFQIISKYDSYQGYILKSQVVEISEAEFNEPDIYVNTKEVKVNISQEEEVLLSIGSNCMDLLNTEASFLNIEKSNFSSDSLSYYCKLYLGVPYLWGGKSSFGIDCSGFTQTIFKFFNIALPRDAWQQCTQGITIDNVDDITVGDLAFFENTTGSIIHVGILLDKETIVHAAGKVRIDKFDAEGILDKSTLERTHHLNSIKRIVSSFT